MFFQNSLNITSSRRSRSEGALQKNVTIAEPLGLQKSGDAAEKPDTLVSNSRPQKKATLSPPLAVGLVDPVRVMLYILFSLGAPRLAVGS